MAFIHGRNAVLIVDDSAAASQNFTGDMNSISLAWTRDDPVTTTLGKDTQQRISGIRDAQLTGAFIWNQSSASTVDTVMQGLMNGSLISRIKFYPAGQVAGCAFYTGCFLVSQYNVQAALNGAVNGTLTFMHASGSLTASTV